MSNTTQKRKQRVSNTTQIEEHSTATGGQLKGRFMKVELCSNSADRGEQNTMLSSNGTVGLTC